MGSKEGVEVWPESPGAGQGTQPGRAPGPPPPHGVVGPWSLVVLGNVDLGAVG